MTRENLPANSTISIPKFTMELLGRTQGYPLGTGSAESRPRMSPNSRRLRPAVASGMESA